MKPIKIQNDSGETIEIKYDSDGVIKIRHSDIDSESWGELQEYSKRIRQAGVQSLLEEKGIDAGRVKEATEGMGGYIIIRGKSCTISAKEVAMIHEAVKQSGGVIPNWSNRP